MSKKRLEHCLRTVQKSSKGVFRDRVFRCSRANVESSNWRHDFARFANVSYADMAKRKMVVEKLDNCRAKTTHSKDTSQCLYAGNKYGINTSQVVGKIGKINTKRKSGIVKSPINSNRDITLKNRFDALSICDTDQACQSEIRPSVIADNVKVKHVMPKMGVSKRVQKK